jgi:hypothetical protein
MVETERKYVQDLEVMQVHLILMASSYTSSLEVEILQRVIPGEYHRPGHNPPSIPEPQQTSQLPTEISYPIREHRRTSVAKPAVGSAFLGKCESFI